MRAVAATGKTALDGCADARDRVRGRNPPDVRPIVRQSGDRTFSYAGICRHGAHPSITRRPHRAMASISTASGSHSDMPAKLGTGVVLQSTKVLREGQSIRLA